jgi:hypothetical protein
MQRLSLWALGVALLTAPGLAWGPDRRAEVETLYKAAVEKPGDEEAFKKYLEALPRYRNRFVVEGDMLRNESQIRIDLAERSRTPVPSAKLGGELIVNTENGVPTFWKERTTRTLTYAVDRASFTDAANHARVTENMAKATRDWEKACGDCGIDFIHKPEHDAAPSHEQVTFIVRQVDAGGAFIAAAFFPNDAPADRFVDIDPSYYSSSFDTVGVLRHELGHVLGFRHEHIRSGAPPVCPAEDTADTIDLSKYDPKSVMHYFCGNVGDQKLRISDVDREASQRLYGPPLDQVTYFE